MNNKILPATIVAITLIGCEGRNPSTETSEPNVSRSEPAVASERAALVEGCVAFREKAFECRETIVDEWIETRAAHRPDIRNALSTESGKAEIRAVALEEFVADGSGPRAPRVEKCQAIVDKAPPSMTAKFRSFETCAASSACEPWGRCVLPKFRDMLESAPQR